MEYTTQRSIQIGVPTLWQSNSLPTPSPIPSGQDLKTASSMVGDATTGNHQHLMPTKTGPRLLRFAIMETVKRYSITIYWLSISKMNYVNDKTTLFSMKLRIMWLLAKWLTATAALTNVMVTTWCTSTSTTQEGTSNSSCSAMTQIAVPMPKWNLTTNALQFSFIQALTVTASNGNKLR